MCPDFIWLVSTELFESNQSVHCFQTLREKKDQVVQLSFISPRVKRKLKSLCCGFEGVDIYYVVLQIRL